MRIAISNIAWDVAEDQQIVALLQRFQIDAIDVAPSKYFPDPVHAKAEDIRHVKAWWADHGIEITGMQSLLFGTTGLNLFGGSDSQDKMLSHLEAVCRIGGGLHGRRLVFGSPKNRDRTGLADKQALEVAIPFFRQLGSIASRHGVIICLEPNPTCYGANFMTTSKETLEVVKQVAHASIKMQLDTGAVTINGEDPSVVIAESAPFIGHVHVSEPDLVPIGRGTCDHGSVRRALEKHLPGQLVSIEMLATKDEPHLASIEHALTVAITHYR